MATIRKRNNSYQIRVSAGYDVSGKQIIKTKTWTPSPGMTERQIEKELDRQAVLFEEKVQTGQFLDGNITLADFSERWFKDYAEKQLKVKTLRAYKDLLPRIIEALGHIHLAKLKPYHLIEFYNNLAEGGIRRDILYKACKDFKSVVSAAGYTQKSLSEAANIGVSTVRKCYEGKTVSKETADKLSAALGKKDIFAPVDGDSPLADTTILKYHRILSSILTTAVQWQVIPSNPCQRVKPPRVKYKEAEILDEKQLDALINSLDSEPLIYKTLIMLALYTGARRGELLGLEWSDIDFKKKTVNINKTVLYTMSAGLYEDTPKTRTSKRVISIPDDMLALLKAWKAEQCEQRLALGDQWKECGKIFTSKAFFFCPQKITKKPTL